MRQNLNNDAQDLMRFKRETFRVSIRRVSTEKIFNENRKKGETTSKDKEIEGFTLTLNPEEIDLELQTWHKSFINLFESNANEEITHLLNALNQYLQINDSGEKIRITIITYHHIHDTIFQYARQLNSEENLHLFHLIILIIANLYSDISFDEMTFMRDQQLMNKLIMGMNYPQLQSAIFQLLANLLGQGNFNSTLEERKQLLLKHLFSRILNNLWLSQQIDLNLQTLQNLAWCINQLVVHPFPWENARLQDLFPIVLDLISYHDLTIQLALLKSLKEIFLKASNIRVLLENGLYEKVLGLTVHENCQIHSEAIERFTDFSIVSLEPTKFIDDLYLIYEKYPKNQKVKCNVSFAISNSIFGTDLQIKSKIYQHKLTQGLFQDALNLNNQKLTHEVLHIIKGFIQHQQSKQEQINLIKFILVKNDLIIQIFIKILAEQKQQRENIFLACQLILSMYELFSKQNINFVQEIFDKFSFQNLLNDMFNSQDEELERFSTYIIENFYQ